MFDPQAFLDMQVTETNDTQIVPVPVGEYTAIVDKIEIKTWQSRDGAGSGLKLNILWSIDDENVKALLGRDTVKVKQDIMLDLTDSGALDMSKGRNINLGRLREATNLNQAGQPFSFPMLQGRLAKVSVSHRINDGVPYAEVKAVARTA